MFGFPLIYIATLIPLSQWKGKGTKYVPPAEVPVKGTVDVKTPLGDQVFGMTADAFFSRLNELLVNKPLARRRTSDDADRQDRHRASGTLSMSGLNAEVRKTIDDGVADAKQAILDQESKLGKVVNGWAFNLKGGHYGTDYLNRASATYFYVGANLPEDAVYPGTTKDSNGDLLDAANKYTLTFPKDDMPPAKNFWSVTMHDKDGYLVPNSINRPSVNDRMKTARGADGELTIHIQADPPGGVRNANWLPTPKTGPFEVYLRLYTPEQKVLDGTWSPPAVQRIK